MVESTEPLPGSPCAVPEIAAAPERIPPVLPEEKPALTLPTEDVTDVVPADEPVGVVMPPMPELPVEEDDRPLHQRLFGTEEEPAIVPAPPQMVLEPETEPADAAPADEPAPAADEASALDPNAVMEVVEAMSGENGDLPADIAADDASADDASDPITQDQ